MSKTGSLATDDQTENLSLASSKRVLCREYKRGKKNLTELRVGNAIDDRMQDCIEATSVVDGLFKPNKTIDI